MPWKGQKRRKHHELRIGDDGCRPHIGLRLNDVLQFLTNGHADIRALHRWPGRASRRWENRWPREVTRRDYRAARREKTRASLAAAAGGCVGGGGNSGPWLPDRDPCPTGSWFPAPASWFLVPASCPPVACCRRGPPLPLRPAGFSLLAISLATLVVGAWASAASCSRKPSSMKMGVGARVIDVASQPLTARQWQDQRKRDHRSRHDRPDLAANPPWSAWQRRILLLSIWWFAAINRHRSCPDTRRFRFGGSWPCRPASRSRPADGSRPSPGPKVAGRQATALDKLLKNGLRLTGGQ